MRNLHNIRPTFTELQLAYLWFETVKDDRTRVRINGDFIEHYNSYSKDWIHYTGSGNDNYVLSLWIKKGRPAYNPARIVAYRKP